MVDVDAREMLLMVECLFASRRTVSSYEVLRESVAHDLGRDGERAVRFLPEGRYAKEELVEALTDALFESRAIVPRQAGSRRLLRPA